MCRFVSIACRLHNKTQHLCWWNYVVSVSDRFNYYEGHFSFLYKSSFNRFQFTLHLRCECIDDLAIQARNTFHKDSWRASRQSTRTVPAGRNKAQCCNRFQTPNHGTWWPLQSAVTEYGTQALAYNADFQRWRPRKVT